MPYLIPEWFEQDAVMLTWPHAATDWADNLDAVEIEMFQFAKAITRHEKLLVVCHDLELRDTLRKRFTEHDINLNQVIFAIASSNDSWARDHGPLTIQNDNGSLTALNFKFNGWGQKYRFESDNAINSHLQEQSCFARVKDIDLILEGGSIEINSKHELLTTTHCLLSEKRNNISRAAMEEQLKHHLGCEQVHWLEHGYLDGDDTDSHIDTLARFINDDTIAYIKCDNSKDQHYSELNKMEQELKALRNKDGQPYTLISLPWPKAQYDSSGQRLPLTYANFLIINKAVLVPEFEDAADKIAQECLARMFPERVIIGIPSKEIIKQFGSLHCLSMQLPKGVLNETKF